MNETKLCVTIKYFGQYTLFKRKNRLFSCPSFNIMLIFRDIVRVVVLNTIFNDISVIFWRSDLLLEETGVPRENHRPAASH